MTAKSSDLGWPLMGGLNVFVFDIGLRKIGDSFLVLQMGAITK